jgi:hypothetical protein
VFRVAGTIEDSGPSAVFSSGISCQTVGLRVMAGSLLCREGSGETVMVQGSHNETQMI